MSAAILRWGRLLAVIALFNFAGAQWIVLQSIAWSGMLLKHAREARLIEAVQTTFDGAHPCHLCKRIDGAKSSDAKTPVPIEISKIPLLRSDAQIFVFAAKSLSHPHPGAASVPSRADSPEYPPPRVSLS